MSDPVAPYRLPTLEGHSGFLDAQIALRHPRQSDDDRGACGTPFGDFDHWILEVSFAPPSTRGRFGLEESNSELTYEVTGDDYRAEFEIRRIEPHISTRYFSFFQIRDGVLLGHFELIYLIERAHASQLEFALPDSTPTTIAIRGLDNVRLKESSYKTEDGRNAWTVLLAEPRRGSVRLAIDFEQRLGDAEAKGLALPVIRSTNVAYQTQTVAIERKYPQWKHDLTVDTPEWIPKWPDAAP